MAHFLLALQLWTGCYKVKLAITNCAAPAMPHVSLFWFRFGNP